MHKLLRSSLPILLPGLLAMSSCSPKYNWREVHGKGAPYVVLMPNNPSTLSRRITLANQTLTMTMTATDVDRASFAVAFSQLRNADMAPATLQAMKIALLRNIDGTERQANAAGSTNGPTAPQEPAQVNAFDIEASGWRAIGDKREPLVLMAHFAAKGNKVYQVIVLGNAQSMPREEAKAFLSSFTIN